MGGEGSQNVHSGLSIAGGGEELNEWQLLTYSSLAEFFELDVAVRSSHRELARGKKRERGR